MVSSLGSSSVTIHKRARHKRFAEINVTPMVDVMLVLLIIFMVTAPMLTAGVQVDLPKTEAAPLQGQDEPLQVSIRSNGKVYVQDTQVGINELGSKLMAISHQKTDTRIFLRGDKNVDYGHIMQVMSAINTSGFTKVALITDQQQEERGRK